MSLSRKDQASERGEEAKQTESAKQAESAEFEIRDQIKKSKKYTACQLDEHTVVVQDNSQFTAEAMLAQLEFIKKVKDSQRGTYNSDMHFIMTVQQFYDLFLPREKAILMQLLKEYPMNPKDAMEKGSSYYAFSTGAQHSRGIDDAHPILQIGDHEDYAKRQVAAFMPIDSALLKEHGDTFLSYSVAKNNPAFGKGGEKQIFIDCSQLRMTLAKKTKLFRNTCDLRQGKRNAMSEIQTMHVELLDGSYAVKALKRQEVTSFSSIRMPISKKSQEPLKMVHKQKKVVEQQESKHVTKEYVRKTTQTTTTTLFQQLKVNQIKNSRIRTAGLLGAGLLSLGMGGKLLQEDQASLQKTAAPPVQSFLSTRPTMGQGKGNDSYPNTDAPEQNRSTEDNRSTFVAKCGTGT